LDYRDFRARAAPDAALAGASSPRADHWRRLLDARTSALTEDEGYALLADYGIGVPEYAVAETVEVALAAARTIGYPLALKTATPGILHKSDVGGVRLGIRGDSELAGAYHDIAGRLGPRVLISALAPAGIEMAFGLVQDASFGSFVMAAFGGTWIEYLKDRVLAMAPLDEPSAERLLSELRLAKVLDGVRGAAPCDRAALVRTFVRLGALAHDLGAQIAEMDLNPVLVSAAGAMAVDCLIIPRRASTNGNS
jgi:acyl-CoA synthetase (NDP forming)